MKNIVRYGILLLLIIPQAIGQTNIQELLSHELDKAILELVKPLVETNNYSGTILISQNDTLLYSGAFGNSNLNGDKNTLNTKFMLASTSMTFTAIAILKLVEEGRLSLDTKLSIFFPNFKNSDIITIHHMLTERSGIPTIENTVGLLNINFLSEPHQLNDLIRYFEDEDLLFVPGEKYNHGRSEYILLARIVELVSEKSFGDFLSEKIFTPLEMHNSGHFSYETNEDDLESFATGLAASGYSDLKKAHFVHWSAKSGHASIYSTVDDLHKFAQAFLNNKFFSTEMWSMMLTDYGNNVGYGCFIRQKNGNNVFSMDGRSPGYSSHLTIDPKNKRVIIMLGNIYNSLPYFTAPKLEAIVEGKPYINDNLTLDRINKDFASTLTGSYKFGPDFYRPEGKVKITFEDGRLYSGGAAMIPTIGPEGKMSKFINRSYWSNLLFIADDSGEIVQLKYDNYVGQKIGSSQIWVKVLSVLITLVIIFFLLKRFLKKSN